MAKQYILTEEYIRKENISCSFLRQKVIDNFIVDFYCHDAKLIIELDGSQHYEEKGLLKDKIRTEKIESRELIVIRIPNNEVNKILEVYASILI